MESLTGSVTRKDLWLAVYGTVKHRQLSAKEYILRACQYLLSRQLKSMCYLNGCERDGTLSAEVLRQLAVVYRCRSPNKLSLIKCAGLLNAAIVRKPSNVKKIKRDLNDFCSHVLTLAKAKKVNLIEESVKFYQSVKKMRNTVRRKVKRLNAPTTESQSEQWTLKQEQKRIKRIATVYSSISKDYSRIMELIMKFCVEIMGSPPCKYALVGMGSLAREEVSPYSDFEHILVLEEGVQSQDNYKKIQEYFRFVSVIFQIIVLNFGETIVPRLYIEGLNCPFEYKSDCTINEDLDDDSTDEASTEWSDENDDMDQYEEEEETSDENTDESTDEDADDDADEDTDDEDWFFDTHTTCGISSDGLAPNASKNPLGRPETQRKPWPTELIKPVSLMLKYLERSKDLKNGYRLADMLLTTCFVEGNRDVYDQFLDGVSSYRRFASNSKIFREELKADFESFDVYKNLSSILSHDAFDVKRVVYRSVTIFVAALGRYHSLSSSSSFAIIEQLQENHVLTDSKFIHNLKFAVATSLEIRLKMYMHYKAQEDQLTSQVVELGTNNFSLVQTVGKNRLVSFFKSCFYLQHFVKETVLDKILSKVSVTEEEDGRNEAAIFLALGWYEEAQQKSASLFKVSSPEASQTHQFVLTISSFMQKKFKKACGYCEEFVEPNTLYFELLLAVHGCCLLKIGIQERGLERLATALDTIKMNDQSPLKYDVETLCLSVIGECLLELEMYSLAVKSSTKAEMMFADTIHNNLSCLYTAASALHCLGQTENALNRYFQILYIQGCSTSDETKDEDIAETLGYIYQCLVELDRWEEAKERKKEELRIYENLLEPMEDISNDQRCEDDAAEFKIEKASCLCDLGNDTILHDGEELVNYLLTLEVGGLKHDVKLRYIQVLRNICIELKKFKKAIEFFGKEVELRENLFLEDGDLSGLLNCYHSFEELLTENNGDLQAKHCFQRELQTLISVDKRNPSIEWEILCALRQCYFSLGLYQKALDVSDEQLAKLQDSIEVLSSTKFAPVIKDKRTADCYQERALTLDKLSRNHDALDDFNSELELRRKLCEEHETYLDVAKCLLNIGFNYIAMENDDLALEKFEESIEISLNAPLSAISSNVGFQALLGKATCLYRGGNLNNALQVCIAAIETLMRSWKYKDDKHVVRSCIHDMHGCDLFTEKLHCFEMHLPKLRGMRRSKDSRNIDCFEMIHEILSRLSRTEAGCAVFRS